MHEDLKTDAADATLAQSNLFQTVLAQLLTRRFLRFAAVGASGVVVNLAALNLFSLALQVNVASAAAIEVSLLSNFALNSVWTFADRKNNAGTLQRLARFHVVCLAGAVLQFIVFVGLNVVWVRFLNGEAGLSAYLGHEHGWFNRWVVLPIVNPPHVGPWIYLSQTVGIGVALFWNFFLNLKWTWGSAAQARD